MYHNNISHIVLLTLAEQRDTVIVLSVCRQNSTKSTNISTLKMLPADIKSYKDQT